METKEMRKNAVDSFNEAWDLIDKKNRTETDNLKMIELAYKSKYYWSLVGDEVNFIRSDWQVSRVFAESKLLEAGLYYAKQCLEGTLEHNLKGFDLFFAYESNVRIYHLMGDIIKRDNNIKKAKRSIEFIEKESDKIYCQGELDKILNI